MMLLATGLRKTEPLNTLKVMKWYQIWTVLTALSCSFFEESLVTSIKKTLYILSLFA
jgi:hypothetical protein